MHCSYSIATSIDIVEDGQSISRFKHILNYSLVLVTEFLSSFLESFERRQTEENAVVHGLVAHFGGRLVGEDKDVMSRVVDCVFLHSVLMAADNREEPLLGNEIKEHLQASGFQVRQDMIEKVMLVSTYVFSFLLTVPVKSNSDTFLLC